MRLVILVFIALIIGCTPPEPVEYPTLDVVEVEGALDGRITIEIRWGAIVLPVALELHTEADALTGAALGSVGLSSLGQRVACILELDHDPRCEVIPERPR